jgi:hypothetical protein
MRPYELYYFGGGCAQEKTSFRCIQSIKNLLNYIKDQSKIHTSLMCTQLNTNNQFMFIKIVAIDTLKIKCKSGAYLHSIHVSLQLLGLSRSKGVHSR